jgi:hypothetical protein
MTHDLFGVAAQEYAPNAAPSVRSHHDQIYLAPCGFCGYVIAVLVSFDRFPAATP